MKKVFSLFLSLLMVVGIFTSIPYSNISLGINAKAVDYSDVYTDELVFMDPTTAEQFIGFIYNVPADKIPTEEKSVAIIYDYLTGVYEKGSLEYIYAQTVFLLTAEAFVNRHLNDNERVYNISIQNLIDALKEEVGDDPNVAEDVVNGALGGLKKSIKKVLYYVGGFDEDVYFSVIDNAMSCYQNVSGISGKARDFYCRLNAVVSTVFTLTSNNAYKSYLYYSTYLNNRHLGPECLDVVMAGFMVDANMFDGIVNILDSIGFGNSWSNDGIQHLIRTFAEFTYHSKREIDKLSYNTNDNDASNAEIVFGQSSYSIPTNRIVQFTSGYYSTVVDQYVTISYSSSDSSVFTVTEDGLLTPVGEGTAELIAKTSTGTTARCYITVYIPNIYIEKIFLPEKPIELAMNTRVVITAGYYPANSNTDTQITYSSSDETVVKVDSSGEIIPIGEGTAKIIATSKNNIQNSCEVKVYPYNVSDNDTGYTIDNYTDSSKSVVIPSAIDGIAITTLGSYSFEGCSELSSITIPNSVVSIDEYVFKNCMNLKSLVIPNSVVKLSYGVFWGCVNLESVTLPSKLKSIDSMTFFNCSNLISVSIPYSITSIGHGAFQNCSSLESIIIPDSVTSIDNYAFSGCTNLTNINIPENLRSISKYTFNDCEKLASITIPGKITQIHNGAFKDCTSLTSIEIPDSVSSLGLNVFNGCTNLVSVTISDNITSLDDGVFQFCDNLTSITIPDSVTNIGAYAFRYCDKLTTITIPSSVLTIGSQAFRYCNSLSTVVFNKGIKSIGSYAFAGCPLISITTPDSLTSVGDYAFSECKKLTSVTFSMGINSIGDSAFIECSELKYIFYPGSENDWENISIGTNNEPLTNLAIHYNATDHTYEDKIDTAVSCTVDGLKHPECIVCSHSLDFDVIPAKGHNYSTKWTIDKAATCTEEGSNSRHCTVCGDKTDVTVIEAKGHNYSTEWIIDVEPTCTKNGNKYRHCAVCGDKTDVSVIDAYGHFYSKEWIIDVAPTCTTEGSKSHHCTLCGEKADVTVIEPTGHIMVNEICQCCEYTDVWEFETYNDYAVVTGYSGDNTNIVIPDTYQGLPVTKIDDGAFAGNETIKSVIIPAGMTIIGEVAFYYCTSLESITVPDSVTSIGVCAFEECYNLTSVTLSDKVTSIGEGAFKSPTSIHCYENSAAHTFAVDNGLNYILINIHSTNDEVDVDYDKKLIRSFVELCTDFADIVSTSDNFVLDVVESISAGDSKLYGTGSKVVVSGDGETIDEYIVVVDGDTNGDSVCDALDAAQVANVSNGHKTIAGAYKMAADNNSDDIVDIEDYQAIVNKVVA